MLKRIVGLVVGTTVACSSFMAFAAEVTSTSTYGSDGKVTVANRVTGVAEGQTLTYLAWQDGVDLAELKGDNIVYIDQVTLASADLDEATQTVYDFSYTADAGLALNADVKIGGTIDAGDETEIVGPMCTVSGKGIVSKDIAPASADEFVPIETTADAKTILSVSVNGAEIDLKDEWSYGVGNSIFVKGSYFTTSTVTVDVVYDTVTEIVFSTIGMGYTEDNNLIIVGEVDGPATNYGVEISLDGGKTYVNEFAALGKGSDGKFAIRITNAANINAENNEVYARVYCGEEVGAVCKVAIGSEASGTWVK